MKKSVIISAVAAALVGGAGAVAFAQSAGQPENRIQPLTNEQAAGYAQQQGATGLMGPGVTGSRSDDSAANSSMSGSAQTAPSAGAYSADTSAQTSSGMASTTTDRSGAGGANYAQNDSGAMMRAGERG